MNSNNNVNNNNENNNFPLVKCILIVLSMVTVAFTMTGKMLVSSEGSIPITHFESFYAYVFAVIMSLYFSYKNHKKANVAIILAILTYFYSYLIAIRTINHITDIEISFDPYFYIYISSSIFLIIALFINTKTSTTQALPPIHSNNPNLTNNVDKNNLHFASLVLGIKGLPYGTDILLVNNIPDYTLDFIYSIDNNNHIFRISKNDIKSITYKNSIKIQNNTAKVISYETKSALLSAAVFGGSPLMQLAGNSLFEQMMDDASGNYNKVELKPSYDISVEALLNGEEIKILLITSDDPKTFVDLINKT